jgi:hypothetical protein
MGGTVAAVLRQRGRGCITMAADRSVVQRNNVARWQRNPQMRFIFPTKLIQEIQQSADGGWG